MSYELYTDTHTDIDKQTDRQAVPYQPCHVESAPKTILPHTERVLENVICAVFETSRISRP